MFKIKEKFSKVLPKNSFIRSVSVLVGGTATAQVIAILASPILTRLYSTEDFGLLAVYGSIIGIVGVIASLRYELAIPIAETDKEAASLVYLSGIILITVSIITGIVFYAFSSQLLGVLKAPALKPFLWLLPLSVFFMGLYNILNYWAIRTKQFGVIARTKFTQSFSSVAVQLAAFKLGAISLLFGQLMGQTAGNTSLFTSALKPHKETFKEVKKGDIVNSAKRWKKFPLFSTWQGLLNTASTQLPPLLLTIFFSPSITGIFMLANRVLNLPMNMIGSAISNVFFSKSVEACKNEKLASLVVDIHKKLANLAMPPMILLLISAPKLFSLVFGKNWIQSGVIAQLMVPWLYFQFIVSPITTLFAVLEKQKVEMNIHLLLLVFRIISLFIGFSFKNYILSIALFSLTSTIGYIVLLVCAFIYTKNRANELIIINLKIFVRSFIICLPLLIIVSFFGHLFLVGFCLTCALFIFYYFKYFKMEFKNDF